MSLKIDTRDVVSQAISQEIEPKLNISQLMTSIEHRFPTIYERLIERGLIMKVMKPCSRWCITRLVGLLRIVLVKPM